MGRGGSPEERNVAREGSQLRPDSRRPSDEPRAATSQPRPTSQPATPPKYAPASQSPARQPAQNSGPKPPPRQESPNGSRRPESPTVAPPTRRPRKRRHVRRWVLSILALLLIAVVAWPVFLVQYGNSKMEHVEALSGRADTPGTTYLIVGSDKRQEEAVNDGTEGERADTIMLLQVPESGTPALVSLPRDSYVEIPDYGYSKINSSYSLGGPELLVQTVENLSGMTVDHYLEVSMFGVQDLVEAVGGVNLCLDYDVQDELSGLTWQAGCHDVDGATALAFSRMRYADPMGDIGRTMRQRQVVGKVIDKAASPATLINPMRQYSLVGKAASNLTTDNDTSMMSLARAGLGLRKVMAPDGLMGTPPIASLDYRTDSGESAVLLDPDLVDDFFARMMNGELTDADFQSLD